MDLTPRTHSDSITIGATPLEVYTAVSDVRRTGEWSPVCRECWWDEGDEPAPGEAPRVGAHFFGRNEVADRTWQTRSKVIAADPGRRFAWAVEDGYVLWSYDLAPLEGGTKTALTESWVFTEAGLTFFVERFGPKAQAHIEHRTRLAHEGIPATLAAIKRVVEAR